MLSAALCALAYPRWVEIPHATAAFGVSASVSSRHSRVALAMAEGGPPKYDKRPASIVSNEKVGRASMLLTVKAEDGEPVDYQAGHVLALEIQDRDSEPGEEKWMAAPYTVTRSSAEARTFDVLYRVVGKKSEIYQASKPGDSLRFGGKYKVPILEGIEREGLERVMGISTGVGVGPLIGFAEEALADPSFPQIHLFLGFREAKDVCCVAALRYLAEAHPERFSWSVILSSIYGHVSAGPNLWMMSMKTADAKIGSTHYHMVGNGAMVNEWLEGLEKAGLPKERITHETYFNHKAEARQVEVEAIENVFKEEAEAEAEAETA